MGVRELDLVQEYTGYSYDMVSGIYYAKARMYDANDRRFMAVDPVKGSLANPQSMAQYTYCLNNPIKYVDKTGQAAQTLESIVTSSSNTKASTPAVNNIVTSPSNTKPSTSAADNSAASSSSVNRVSAPVPSVHDGTPKQSTTTGTSSTTKTSDTKASTENRVSAPVPSLLDGVPTQSTVQDTTSTTKTTETRASSLPNTTAGSGADKSGQANAGAGKDTLFALNDFLSLEQMQVNAAYINNYLYADGWSNEAIASLLGNMQAESTISHGRWQSGKAGNMAGGFGLVQWTPASDYFDWAKANDLDPYDIDTQLYRISLEVKGEIRQWQSFRTNENSIFKELFGENYDMTFEEFSKCDSKTPEELAAVFLLNYERPKNKSKEVQNERGENARYWYKYLE